MMEKRRKFNFKTWLISGLRRMSYRYPARNEALKLARIERGLYKCAMCEGTFKNKEFSIDHIVPVVSVKNGFTNWDNYINQLFCDVTGFQILCHSCHDAKTAIEDSMRTDYNKKAKKSKKKVDKIKK